MRAEYGDELQQPSPAAFLLPPCLSRAKTLPPRRTEAARQTCTGLVSRFCVTFEFCAAVSPLDEYTLVRYAVAMTSRKIPSAPAPPALSGPGAPPRRPAKKLSLRERMPWLPWVLPFALFLVLTSLEKPFEDYYPWFYAAKMALVTAVLLRLRRFLPEAAPSKQGLGLAVGLGLVLAVLWVAVDFVTPHVPALLGTRIGYNPFQKITNTGGRDVFLLVRFYGLVVVAPVCEELFYRGFLLRFVTDMDDFRKVPIGRFSTTAFAVTVVLMASSHPEWLSALVFSAALCALLARTRSLFACIVCHGVSNLALGVYVLAAHAWKFW